MPRIHLVRLVALAVMIVLAASAPLSPNSNAYADDWSITASPSPNDCVLRSVATVANDEAWAVGSHLSNSFENHTLILHWIDGRWSQVESPNLQPTCIDGNVQFGGNSLYGLEVVTAADMWAVGSGCYARETLIEHWNGNTWSVVASPNPVDGQNVLSGVSAASTADVWAVGYTGEAIDSGTLIEHWDGTSWSVVPSPRPGTGGILTSVDAVSATDAWAVGTYYDDQTHNSEPLIVHWDGGEWRMVDASSLGDRVSLHSVAAVSANDVWVVGAQHTLAGVRTFAVRWDGAAWNVVPTAEPTMIAGTSSLHSLAVVSANDVWASGSYHGQNTDLDQHRTLIEHWDGSAWSIVESPSPGASADLGGIAARASGEVWAVGVFSEYPVNIYDGTYTLPQTLVLTGRSTVNSSGVTPSDFETRAWLAPPRPNPSSDHVSLSVHLTERAAVELKVFDVRGREVRSLIHGTLGAGDHSISWDRFDAQGRMTEPGLYFARLVVGGRVVASRSMAVLGSRSHRDG